MVGPVRGRAEPDVPVERRGHGRDLAGRVDALGPDGPVGPAVDLGDVADGAAPDPLADEAGALAGVALVAHLGHDVGLLGRLGQEAGLLDRMGQRFLDVDVLAQLDGGHGDDGVVVIGGRHGHGVDALFLLQHAPEVAVLGRLLVHGLLGRLELLVAQEPGHGLVVDVAEGDDVLGAAAPGVGAAHAADGDTGDVERVARGLLLRGLSDDVAGDDHEPGRGRRGRAQELPPAPARLGGRGVLFRFVHIGTFLIGRELTRGKERRETRGCRRRAGTIGVLMGSGIRCQEGLYHKGAERVNLGGEKRRPGPSLWERPGREKRALRTCR